MAGREGNEMGEALHRDGVAVVEVSRHGVGQGHELGHQAYPRGHSPAAVVFGFRCLY